MSKNVLGQSNPEYSLQAIFEDEDCSVAKLGDRVNNISSMVGVFKKARLIRYVEETINEFLTRIKISRRLFPYQEAVYENMKLEIKNQLKLVDKIIDGYTPHE